MKRFPKYPTKPHRSRQARIVLFGRHVYLGLHGSPESWAEYHRLLGLWRAGGLAPGAAPAPPAPALTVADLAARYLTHLERSCPPGSRQVEHVADALAPLVALLGGLPAADARAKALRDALASAARGEWMTDAVRSGRRAGGRKLEWSPQYAAVCFGKWKAMFRWGSEEELVPPSTWHSVSAAKAPGGGARRKILPAPEQSLAAIPCLHPVTRALVECLLLTGARPGELFRLTPADIVRGGRVEVAPGFPVELGAVWAAVYAEGHKTAHRGQGRVVLFGPQAQRILAPLLEGRPPDRPVFCPQEASRRAPDGPRGPKPNYDRHSLGQAIERACARAGVPRFTAYSLRHNAACHVAAEFGAEVARALLGHSGLKTTEHYLARDVQAAAEAMRRVG